MQSNDDTPNDPAPSKIGMEEKLAHLDRTVAELSDVVARQDQQLSVLSRRLASLMQREAEREADAGGSVVLGDEKPPHW